MSITITPTINTPYVQMDPDKSTITIKGQSIEKSPANFYDKLINKFEEFILVANDPVILEIDLANIDNDNEQYITKLLTLFDTAYEGGRDIRINWIVNTDNPEIEEFGKLLMKNRKISFQFTKEDELVEEL